MNASQKELFDGGVATRRKIQFGHMRRVVSGEVDFNQPFGTTPPALRPAWAKRKNAKRQTGIGRTKLASPKNL